MSISKTKSKKWLELSLYPGSSISVPTGMDQNDYIVIDHDWFGIKINCIYKYDIVTDKWNKMDSLQNISNISPFSAALDASQQMLFLSHSDSVTQIQLHNEHINNHIHNGDIGGVSTGQSIIINNSLFIVGCWKWGNDNSIFKWNSQNSYRLTTFSDVYETSNICEFGMLYNNTNNSLLLFGGYDWMQKDYMNCILEFNINNKQWNKLEVLLPNKISNICCTMAIRKTYVLLFGGYSGEHGYCDDIYIYSMRHKTIRESKMKCPSKSQFKCLTINDNIIRDEKLVFGYVRNEWNQSNISHYCFPPYYLLKLMQSYYLNEFVFLLDTVSKRHFKINTLDII